MKARERPDQNKPRDLRTFRQHGKRPVVWAVKQCKHSNPIRLGPTRLKPATAPGIEGHSLWLSC